MASNPASPLAVSGVVAGYGGDEPVLRGVDLVAEAGQVSAIIGPNGSGKSSLLRTICGQLRQKAGTISINGADATHLRPKDMRRHGIRYVPQNNASFPGLSVRDNLRLAGWALRLSETEIDEAIEVAEQAFTVLRDKRKLMAGYLSGGELRQLEFARTLMGQPKLILLDEPSAGLSPKMTTEIYVAITNLKAPGRGIVLVDQNVPKAIDVSDIVYELRLGRVARRILPGTHQAHAIITEWLNA